MRLIKKEQIDEAVAQLKQGAIIVFPTETSYGLGCDATNQKAVDRIFKIKGRSSNKPLLVIVSNIKMAKKYLKWNDLLEKIAKKYWPASPSAHHGGPASPPSAHHGGPASLAAMRWRSGPSAHHGGPGPLTVVGNFKKRGWKFWQTAKLAKGIVCSDTLAVRVSGYPLAKMLSERLNRPIVATSANLSSTGDIYDSQEIISQFAGRELSPDILIDGKVLPFRKPTTIISAVNNQFKIIRQGECIINF